MLKLLCCPSCNRQFDATRLSVGSRFRCRCGAAREEGATSCGYCGSDFTIHEQDLETICPACGDGRGLASRPLGDTRLAVLECGVCTGLWLGAEVFRTIEERARASQLRFKVEPKSPENAGRVDFGPSEEEAGFDAVSVKVNWLLKP